MNQPTQMPKPSCATTAFTPDGTMVCYCTAAQLQAYGEAKRREALEEAAKACQTQAARWAHTDSTKVYAAMECFYAIRYMTK